MIQKKKIDRKKTIRLKKRNIHILILLNSGRIVYTLVCYESQ